MRRPAFGLALLQTLFPPSSGAAAKSEVVETIRYEPYSVAGDSIADVRRQMDRMRPLSHDALTKWHVTWRYDFRKRLGFCFIDNVRTTLEIVYILPELRTSNIDVRRSFDAYGRRLKIHEDGHARIGRIIANRIHARLPEVGPYASCLQLEQAANALGNRLVQEGADMDEAYDLKTDHGLTQGARWP